MFKKLFFLIITSLISSNFSWAQIVPLKKPSLSSEELNKKIILNTIKPLKKPSKVKVEKKVINKETKLSFLLPKKKPVISGFINSETAKISKFYNKKDFGIAKKAIGEMQKGQWNSAIKISKKAKDRSIYNFIKWRHLLTTGNQESFFDYQVFINENSDYPRMDRLRYLAEHKLSTEKVSPRKIINWFSKNEPLSGYGKMILGESHILSGDKEKGIGLIKNGWISADLSKSELKFFRKKYKKYLDVNDYIKRADHLAWNSDHWDLKRLIRYLPKDYELLYTARHILMTKGYGVDQAIKNVPNKFKNDAGLNYDRLKWRRKKGRLESSTEILLKIRNDKDYLVRPEKWWKEREIISRKLIYKKQYELAYKISSNHGMSE